MPLRHYFCLLLITILPTLALAIDTCDLSVDTASRAKQIFTSNQTEGLKLYIQAQQLCASDPAYSYNLGMAYYRAGKREEAAAWLGSSVTAKEENPVWRNNLAWVQLELGQLDEAFRNARTALAQTPFDGRIQDTLNRINLARNGFAGKHDVAVVIGNSNYSQAKVPNIDYARRDAAAMRGYLVNTLGYDPGNVLYLEDATLTGFFELFGTNEDHRAKLYNYIKPGESNLFIYYVGHGAPDLQNGDAYFVPVDANPRYLRTSGYRLNTFYSNLARLPVKNITVVLDSCFSGNSAGGYLYKEISSINLRLKAIDNIPANAVVLTSAKGDQVSSWYPEKEHSLFTYYLLQGVQGAADHDGDKKITVAELESYLGEKVSFRARRNGIEQQPTVTGDRGRVVALVP